MAASRPLISDPMRSFKFNVVIPMSIRGGGGASQYKAGMARLGFMQVQGLGISIEPLTYREGGDNITTRKMPGQADFNPVTLSRGEFSRDPDNWYWITNLFTAMYGGGMTPVAGATYVGSSPDFRTHVYINVLQHPNNQNQNAPGNPMPSVNIRGGVHYNSSFPQQPIVQLSIKLFSAWIGTLAYSDLDAGGNAVGIEQMTLNHEGFDMRWGNPYVTNPTSW